jgi:hypothetical protein
MNRMSDPGRILISETLRDLLLPWIAKEPFYVFTTHGNYQLEGQKDHLEVYEFGLSQNRIVPPLKTRKKIPRLPRWFFLLLFAGLGYILSLGVEFLRDFYAHPTVYFYDFRSERLVLDDKYELFLDDTETEGKKRLSNQVTPGRHSLSVNQGGRRTRIYYLFDVVPGVNNLRPEFTEYTLPEYQSSFTYSSGKRSFEEQKEFTYTVIDENLEEVEKNLAVDVEIKGELGGGSRRGERTIHFKGRILFTTPNGEVEEIPVDLKGDPDSPGGVSVPYKAFWTDANTEYSFSLNQDRRRLVISIRGQYHPLNS